MIEPKVSVVSAWYNRAAAIEKSIGSLLAQSLRDIEIVVVNDGSPDGAVRERLDALASDRLHVVHQRNAGFTDAILHAIELTRAPYIAIHGAGDVSLPERLGKQLAHLEARPDHAMVSSHYEKVDATTGAVELIMPRTPKQGDLNFRGISHGELMYRRAAYDAAGGYRRLFSVGQGGDLWSRMLRTAGAGVIPELLYRQTIYPDGVSKSVEKRVARHLMNALRTENEKEYRRSGVDLIDTFGPAAFAILSRRERVEKTLAQLSAEIALAEDAATLPDFRLDLKLRLAAARLKWRYKRANKRIVIAD